jgi:hypothetical protein
MGDLQNMKIQMGKQERKASNHDAAKVSPATAVWMGYPGDGRRSIDGAVD